MNIYWHKAGPLLDYDGRRLLIGDLNPESERKWLMTRWEAFRVGVKFIRAALFPVR